MINIFSFMEINNGWLVDFYIADKHLYFDVVSNHVTNNGVLSEKLRCSTMSQSEQAPSPCAKKKKDDNGRAGIVDMYISHLLFFVKKRI